MTPLSCSLVLRSFVGLTLLMTPLSYSLVVRALVGPALVNDPLSSCFLVRAFVGPALVHDPPFLLSADIALLVLATAHETKPALLPLAPPRLVPY